MNRSPGPPITHAFVYAAGLGTRLRPYTLHTPKPMLEVFGRPLVEYVLCALKELGVEHVTVNAAWLAEAFDGLPERGRALGLDVAVSRQPEPYEHGGDLAFATAFLARLGDDDRFLALNGDTLFRIDPSVLNAAAARVTEDAPFLFLVHDTEANPLHVRTRASAEAGGRLVGIGAHRYTDEEPDAHGDDFGIKVVHASIRRYLPEPGTTMSLHGANGLLARLYADGKAALVHPVGAYERAEIGTVADYEGRAANAALRALTARLCAGA